MELEQQIPDGPAAEAEPAAEPAEPVTDFLLDAPLPVSADSAEPSASRAAEDTQPHSLTGDESAEVAEAAVEAEALAPDAGAAELQAAEAADAAVAAVEMTQVGISK